MREKVLLAVVIALLIAACDVGPVNIPPGARVEDDVRILAGQLTVGDEAIIKGRIDMTAGQLLVGVGVRIEEGISITAGEARLGAGCHTRNIDMAAGKVDVDKGSRIDNNIEFAAGEVILHSVAVGRDIRFSAGVLRLLGNSHIAGEIIVDGASINSDEETRIYIAREARIDGRIFADYPIAIIADEGAQLPADISANVRIEWRSAN
jgi:cytoskeletal protein CcmA (bactofilin family)